MESPTNMPFYQKLTYILISTALVIVALIYGGDIVLPILFSILLANILLPLTQYLARRKFRKSFSILLPLFLSIIVGMGVIYFLSSQIMNFIDDVPALKERVTEVSHSVQVWFRSSTDITIRKQNQYLKDTVTDLKEKAPGLVGLTFNSLVQCKNLVLGIPYFFIQTSVILPGLPLQH